jgi:type IV secretory pathway VirB10-like protein
MLIVALVAVLLSMRSFQKPPPQVTAQNVPHEEVVPSISGPQAGQPDRTPQLRPPPKEEKVQEEVPALEGRGSRSDRTISNEPKLDKWAGARSRGTVAYDVYQPQGVGGSQSELQQSAIIQGAQVSAPAETGMVQAAADGSGRSGGTGRQFADRLRPAQLEGVSASRFNPTYVITKGTVLSKCRIDQAVNTELPGMITCTLAGEVRGADGQVVLMTPGSKLVGEYHSGLELGEQRFFAVWTRYEDLQTHVIIALDSPATDSLGRAGISGTIDTKALQRFGPPILFSILTDLPQYLESRNGGAGTTFNAFSNTQGTSQEALRSVMETYSKLRPTLTKDQGGVVSVISARDLDFSSVYPLKMRRKP